MTLTVLVVDDESRYRDLYAQVLNEAGLAVCQAATAEEALQRIEADPPHMVVSDVRMPGQSGLQLLESVRARGRDLPFLLVTAYADIRDAVAALKLGAVDYLAKPVDLDELVASVQDALGVTQQGASAELPAGALADIVASAPAMRAVIRDAWRVAQSDVNVLVTGESGTGKEVLARFIHDNSARAKKPFVPLNCAALPATLLASELFGHERGAFTGATGRRDGRFREAQGGTLFLDEIGDMPLELQPVLLRAIEQRRVTPLGATGEVPVDFRLVAATNRRIEDDVAAGRFRADLFFRLNVITLDIPPLRERPDDIVPLARKFLAAPGQTAVRLSRAALQTLLAYDWPGNVRELANAMARARLLANSDVILPDNLPPAVRRAALSDAPPGGAPAGDKAAAGDGAQTIRQAELAAIHRALAQTGGNHTRAAERLGITRRGLIKKLKRLGL